MREYTITYTVTVRGNDEVSENRAIDAVSMALWGIGNDVDDGLVTTAATLEGVR